MNPLGVKGVGEAGTIGCSPAVVNSVVDALSPLGVRHLDMPLTPEKMWKRDPGRRPRMIPQPFDYSAPASAGGGAGTARLGRQAAGGRHEPDPDDEAAFGRARAPGGPGADRRAQRNLRAGRLRSASARRRRIFKWSPARWCGGDARCWPRWRRASATFRCATWARSAEAWRMPIRRRTTRPRCSLSRRRSGW